MVEAIRSVIKRYIENISWMDDLTKDHALQKVQKLKSIIGFVDGTDSTDDLENMYGQLSIGHKHLKNVVNLKKDSMRLYLSQFGKSIPEQE